MTAPLQPVWIHPSQFPEALEQARARSLQAAAIDHRFHYLSAQQGELWLALHRKYAPTERASDPLYADMAAKATALAPRGTVLVVALGCGGGEKDLILVERLRQAGRKVRLIPIDAGVGLALHSARAA